VHSLKSSFVRHCFGHMFANILSTTKNRWKKFVAETSNKQHPGQIV